MITIIIIIIMARGAYILMIMVKDLMTTMTKFMMKIVMTAIGRDDDDA